MIENEQIKNLTEAMSDKNSGQDDINDPAAQTELTEQKIADLYSKETGLVCENAVLIESSELFNQFTSILEVHLTNFDFGKKFCNCSKE